jgi:hypothetical protein
MIHPGRRHRRPRSPIRASTAYTASAKTSEIPCSPRRWTAPGLTARYAVTSAGVTQASPAQPAAIIRGHLGHRGLAAPDP